MDALSWAFLAIAGLLTGIFVTVAIMNLPCCKRNNHNNNNEDNYTRVRSFSTAKIFPA